MKTFIASTMAAAAAASVASADLSYSCTFGYTIVSFTNQTWTGFGFSDVSLLVGGNFVGTLTGVSVNATLNASVAFTYADDLCIYVDVLPLGTGGLLQVGGFSNLSAAQRLSWANGGASAPGTTVIDTKSVNPIVFGGLGQPNIWVGNGYGAAGTSGTWTGSITLIGITPCAPAPGAVALLGFVGLSRSRRR
jgi:hypothetical protein